MQGREELKGGEKQKNLFEANVATDRQLLVNARGARDDARKTDLMEPFKGLGIKKGDFEIEGHKIEAAKPKKISGRKIKFFKSGNCWGVIYNPS
jgi:hypothetical protein